MPVRRLGLFKKLSLRTRLITIMLAMLAASLLANYLICSRIEQAALSEVQSHVETLSKAIEVSVQQLHVEGKPAEEVLKDYQSSLQSSGVEEITILNADHRVLASTHTARHQSDPSERGISSYHQRVGLHESYDLTIPIVADDDLLGYVHINLALSNFNALFRNLLHSRMLLSVEIFGLGILIVLPLISYLTRPIKDLTSAAHQVAMGNFDITLPQFAGADVAPLVSNFLHMVERLKLQKKLETQLAESERAAAVGRMASGIAHDIRNPLNFVSLGVEHLRHKWNAKGKQDPEVQNLFEGTRAELSRVSGMIQDFLDYGREHSPQLEEEDARGILFESLGDLRRRHGNEASRIRVEVMDMNASIRVERTLLKRALINLLENALEAGSPDGEVTAGLVLDGGARKHLTFWIQDQGPGIAPENLQKIFTPYFTTKRSGVGLGLALARKWINEMGGTIRVRNMPDKGARFELSFSTT